MVLTNPDHEQRLIRDPSKSRPRVLLADDDRTVRFSLSQALMDEGYEVLQAADGVDLLHLLEFDTVDENWTASADVVVSDIRMPGVTGMEILEGLTSVDWATKVILISAFLDDKVKAQAHEMGVAAVLEKPFPLQALLDAVHRIVPPPELQPGHEARAD